MTRTMRQLASSLLAVLLLAACASTNQAERQRQEALNRWESLVRWSEFHALADMIHPDWLAENPIPDLDLRRLEQFRVTQYRVRSVLTDPDGQGLERIVEIRLYHKHSAYERVIEHREVWRYDEDRERWLLHSGLPDPRPG